ncbi:two-component system response regulator [Brevirhabdus pacifica]|uniref:Two-component system response regulator n=1 Tax=Brevirhabdus pacifica TaxID=1267768 RepID=A0A1U7DH08_9RHOB|nr:ANTAR domain-containing protein [Brevirhabdus pacifica]APX89173.1 two-component system response regulator [Brevirhabdus pacifica]OWU76771.1 chemotaxis protein CheY [Loktanella sp. 22II-4b]PJJ86232.1 response regulator receiver and ANTAR domain protein [Brevirhabdus pacifica]
MQRRLKITIVESDPARAALIEESLSLAGQYELTTLTRMAGLTAAIAATNPDIVLIDLDNPSRDTLEELTLATAPLERPVALFVDQSDANLTRIAIEAGVSAYVVDGLRADRLKPVLDAAVTRFEMFRQMRVELAATKRALEERKVIDRAKGILMKAKGLDEGAAYALLRRAAMDQGRKVVDVAEALVSTAGLLS